MYAAARTRVFVPSTLARCQARSFSCTPRASKVYANADSAVFEEHALKGSKLVLVDWNAVWCAPCKMIAPSLHAIATTPALTGGSDIDLVEVDVDENANLAADYKVRAMPTVTAFRQGKKLGQFVGVQPQDAIVEWIKTFEKA